MRSVHYSSLQRTSRTLWLVGLLVLCAALPLAGEGVEPSCWPGEPGSDPRACPPDDPRYPRHWEFRSDIPQEVDRDRMHPRERALGSIGASVDTAWQRTIGRPDVVIAVLDSGILWDYEDLVHKLYLNRGELPPPAGSVEHDRNGDGVFDVRDYAGDPRVADGNDNGILDPEDLILAFSNCRDDDRNGYPDDISGYDFVGGSHCGFQGGENDARDDTGFRHGTGIASSAAAETNNGVRDVGVCPLCRILPVRVGDTFVVDANRFARGVVFAVRSGASVIGSALGAYNNTHAGRAAVDFAYERGVPIIASAADEFSYHHNYPSVYNHALYVNAIRFNHASDYREATTFWGLNPCTNFGARVWVTMPALSCSSGATSRLAGVAGLMVSMARDSGLERLHPEELYQVLRATADDLDNSSPDWSGLYYPARSGFDQLSGYGRVHAERAVAAVQAGRIPPAVDLLAPRWFAVVSPRRTPRVSVSAEIRVPRAERASYRLAYALGVEPREDQYRTVASGTVVGSKRGTLGSLDFTRLPLPRGPAPRNRDERDRYSVTLRLSATDERGLTSEARRSFFVFHDPEWKEHFPVDLDVSGEASPLLTDLDADGRDEIVLATAEGFVRILDWSADGLRIVRAPLEPRPRIDPLGATSHRETLIRGPAVGDLRGDGRPVIVVASREGKVYAFEAHGERLAGFPAALDPARGRPGAEAGVLSRPVLADLDGRPGLEIVVSALDGHVYAWRRDGAPLAGFPVRLTEGEKIVSTPAVGDIDGDGRPEIVVGSNRIRGEIASAYAIRAGGGTDPRGALVTGWNPFEIPAVRPGLLPTVASGIVMEPALADTDADGDDEVVLYAVTGDTILLVDQTAGGPVVRARLSMVPGERSGFRGVTFLAGTGSPIVTDTDGDGGWELYAPLLSMRMLTLRTKPGVPLDVPLGLGGWTLGGSAAESRVPMLADFPRRMEDLMIYARPAAADLDGDGVKEILMGSGGYLLHAFRPGGGEAPGFPKFTGGWIFSQPAVGDIDGDGRPDVVTITREGYLFAWSPDAPASSAPAR